MPNKKTRLAKRAAKANAKAKEKGRAPVGTRRVINYSNPRDLGGGTSIVPVYKREKKIRDKILKVKTKTPKTKSPKIGNINKRKSSGPIKNRKTKADKAKCSFDNKRGRQRNKRKHSSCK